MNNLPLASMCSNFETRAHDFEHNQLFYDYIEIFALIQAR
jgi:hypothetical protein